MDIVNWVNANKDRFKWFNDKILEWDKLKIDNGKDFKSFIFTENIEENGAINARSIKGQWNHYAGNTWINALLYPNYKPSSMKKVIWLANDNPTYYFSSDRKADICYVSFDGEHWYSSQGNHRTVVGKFVCEYETYVNNNKQMIRGVDKIRYYVDWEAVKLYERLTKFVRNNGINLQITVEKIDISRYCFEPVFFIHLFKDKNYECKKHKSNKLLELLKIFFFTDNNKYLQLDRWEFKIFANWFIKEWTNLSFINKIRRYIDVNLYNELNDKIWFPDIIKICGQRKYYNRSLIKIKHKKCCPTGNCDLNYLK